MSMITKNVLAITGGIAFGLSLIGIIAISIWFTSAQQKTVNVLQYLPFAQTSFVIKGVIPADWQLPDEAKDFYANLPADTQYIFGMVGIDGGTTYAFATPSLLPNTQSDVHTSLQQLHVYSNGPINIPIEPVENSVDAALPNIAENSWKFVQPNFRKSMNILPILTSDDPLLLTSNAIHILHQDVNVKPSYTFVQADILPNATNIAFAGESLRFIPETDRVLLISRLEYLWSYVTKNQATTLEQWLSATESETVTIHLANDDSLFITGLTNNVSTLDEQMPQLQKNRIRGGIEWEENTKTLDTFTSSTIEHVADSHTEPQVVENWKISTIQNTSYGQRDGAWFVTNIPLEKLQPAIDSVTTIDAKVLAFGTLQVNTREVLPLQFLPQNTPKAWIMEVSPKAFTLREQR